MSGLDVTGATVTITDDDTRGVRVSETTVEFGEGGSGTYTVVLESQPTATVTVGVSVAGDPDVTVSPPSLEFGTGDWHEPRTVTVRAAHDADADDDEATVSHEVSGGDYGANGVTAAPVEVSVDRRRHAVDGRDADGDARARWARVRGETALEGHRNAERRPVRAGQDGVAVGERGDRGGVGLHGGHGRARRSRRARPPARRTLSLTPVDDRVDEDDETVTVDGHGAGSRRDGRDGDDPRRRHARGGGLGDGALVRRGRERRVRRSCSNREPYGHGDDRRVGERRRGRDGVSAGARRSRPATGASRRR